MTILNPKRIERYLKELFFPRSYLLKRRSERFLRSKYEHEITIIDQLTDKNNASIDVGVYRGVYSFQLLKHSSHVYAYEANPLIFNELKQAFRKEKRITLENIALSSKEGVDVLRIPVRDKSKNFSRLEDKYELGLASIHSRNKLENKELFEIEVKRKKLDDCDISHAVSFIKIDVEGHEVEILKGAVQLINKYKPNLLVEIEERHTGRKLINIVNEINSFGYNCFVLEETTNQLIEVDEANIKSLNKNNFIFRSIS